ncbi:MAG: hypothetical protein HQL53_13185 [Magnetococcales bacterium]|nr:hypothetical protein [Magnetococcales bacterium]
MSSHILSTIDDTDLLEQNKRPRRENRGRRSNTPLYFSSFEAYANHKMEITEEAPTEGRLPARMTDTLRELFHWLVTEKTTPLPHHEDAIYRLAQLRDSGLIWPQSLQHDGHIRRVTRGHAM